MTIILQQVLFVVAFAYAIYFFIKRIKFLRRNIFLGKKDNDRTDNPAKRFKNMVLFALGQKKMFKKWIPAIMHFLIYVGFVLINLELVEIVLDGFSGSHRILAPVLAGFYPWLISFLEILALGVLLSCFVFLYRRNVQKINRFHKVEMKGWPTLDGNLILVFEIVLIVALLMMNALDQQLQAQGVAGYVQTGNFLITQHLSPLFASFDASVLVAAERFFWWIHILGIFFFLNYVTYSKHLHIILAFPNTYFGSLENTKGKMQNMPVIQHEVELMMNPDAAPPENVEAPPEYFGAKDVTDLSWKNLLDAYSCTECGRCTAACPANLTGKKLSPRKIMMDTRDRADQLGTYQDANGAQSHDGKQLIGDFISQEELKACTTCNACVEECPININPLDIILQLRRHLVMDLAEAPNEWNVMFGNVENNMAPWQFSPDDRLKWADEVAIKTKD